LTGREIAGDGPVESDGDMSEDWGGRGKGGVSVETEAVSRTARAIRDPECSGFFSRPKVGAVFAARREIGDENLLENVPIMSSLPTMTPITHVEES
jgi:hypothetical protein